MISECAFTGKPIYVYHLPFKRISNRIESFHNEFENKKIVAFSGIGNPENFFDLLKDNKMNIVEKIKFHDPLAPVTIFNESVCSYKKGTVTIQREDNDFDGITIWEENTNGPHRIGSTVNVERFFESYFRVFQ